MSPGIDEHFQKQFNILCNAAKNHAQTLNLSSLEYEQIFFAIGYMRSHLEINKLLPATKK